MSSGNAYASCFLTLNSIPDKELLSLIKEEDGIPVIHSDREFLFSHVIFGELPLKLYDYMKQKGVPFVWEYSSLNDGDSTPGIIVHGGDGIFREYALNIDRDISLALTELANLNNIIAAFKCQEIRNDIELGQLKSK